MIYYILFLALFCFAASCYALSIVLMLRGTNLKEAFVMWLLVKVLKSDLRPPHKKITYNVTVERQLLHKYMAVTYSDAPGAAHEAYRLLKRELVDSLEEAGMISAWVETDTPWHNKMHILVEAVKPKLDTLRDLKKAIDTNTINPITPYRRGSR